MERQLTWLEAILRRLARRARSASTKGPVVTSVVRGHDPSQRRADGRSATGGGFGLPQFRSTADDRNTAAANDRFTTLRVRLRKAYTPALPVEDRNRFAGRVEMMGDLIRSLEDQRLHIIVHGVRGIGKTSLLHVLSQAAREARYTVVYISCGEASSFDDVFRSVAAQIPLLYYGETAPRTQAGEASLADVLPGEPVTPRSMTDLFAKVVGTRVLIALDEFDRCESAEFRRCVAELIKNLSDRAARVQLVIAGVATDVTQLFEFIPSIRRNVVVLQVPKMQPAEIKQIIHNGEHASGIVFAPAAADYITSVAHGSPYLANLLSHHAALAAVDGGSATVNMPDASLGLDRALAELRGRISKRALAELERTAGEGMHNVLGLLAGTALFSGGQFTAADIQALYISQSDAADCQALVERAAAQNAILDIVGEEPFKAYRFREDGLPAYLWVRTAKQRLGRAAQPKAEAPLDS